MKIKTYQLLVVILYCLLCSSPVKAQTSFGLSFHQSIDTKIGAFVDIERWAAAEIRVTDFVRLRDFSTELLGFYKFTARESSEIYAGGGYGLSNIFERSGPIIAAGATVYPFKNKNFGVHFELNPIFTDLEEPIMRVSWGLRFRFGEKELIDEKDQRN